MKRETPMQSNTILYKVVAKRSSASKLAPSWLTTGASAPAKKNSKGQGGGTTQRKPSLTLVSLSRDSGSPKAKRPPEHAKPWGRTPVTNHRPVQHLGLSESQERALQRIEDQVAQDIREGRLDTIPWLMQQIDLFEEDNFRIDAHPCLQNVDRDSRLKGVGDRLLVALTKAIDYLQDKLHRVGIETLRDISDVMMVATLSKRGNFGQYVQSKIRQAHSDDPSRAHQMLDGISREIFNIMSAGERVQPADIGLAMKCAMDSGSASTMSDTQFRSLVISLGQRFSQYQFKMAAIAKKYLTAGQYTELLENILALARDVSHRDMLFSNIIDTVSMLRACEGQELNSEATAVVKRGIKEARENGLFTCPAALRRSFAIQITKLSPELQQHAKTCYPGLDQCMDEVFNTLQWIRTMDRGVKTRAMLDAIQRLSVLTLGPTYLRQSLESLGITVLDRDPFDQVPQPKGGRATAVIASRIKDSTQQYGDRLYSPFEFVSGDDVEIPKGKPKLIASRNGGSDKATHRDAEFLALLDLMRLVYRDFPRLDFSRITGTVDLHISQEPCFSCVCAMAQFRRLFPNIDLAVKWENPFAQQVS